MRRSLFRALPSMDSLVIFEQAVRHGSFTKAGAHLGLTQSAVSRQILDLEAMLNAKLFDRTRRLLQLTPAGREFKEVIEPMLEGLESAVVKMQLRLAQGNFVNISVAASFCNMWFIRSLPDFYRNHAGPQINVTPHVGFVDLAAGKSDAAIINANAAPAGCVSMKLMDIVLAPYAAPSLFPRPRQKAPTLRSLSAIPVLHLREAPGDWKRFLRLIEMNRLVTESVGNNSLFLLNYEAVKAGMGAALLPPELVRDDEVAGQLLRLHEATLPLEKSYHLIWRAGSDKEKMLTELGQWMQRRLAAKT